MPLPIGRGLSAWARGEVRDAAQAQALALAELPGKDEAVAPDDIQVRAAEPVPEQGELAEPDDIRVSDAEPELALDALPEWAERSSPDGAMLRLLGAIPALPDALSSLDGGLPPALRAVQRAGAAPRPESPGDRCCS